jgi:sugar-specific transcriptional regulator TrmB
VTIQEKDSQTLAKLGFTPSQAKLYLTLLKIGRASGRTISKHSRVARQEVYRILSELQEMGLVEKVIATPCEFRPIPIQNGLSILLMQKAKEYRETEKTIGNLLQKFKHSEEKTPREEEPKFILIPKGEALIKRIRDELENAQLSVEFITTAKRFLQAFDNYFKVCKKALDNGVKFRVIIEKPEDYWTFPKTLQTLLAKPNFKLRYICTLPKANVKIFDNKEVFITVYPAVNLTESPVILTNHFCLIAICQDYFETIWNQAVECKLTELNCTRNRQTKVAQINLK